MANKKPKVKEIVLSGEVADGIVVLALKQMREIVYKNVNHIYTISSPSSGQLADAAYYIKAINHIDGVLEFYGN